MSGVTEVPGKKNFFVPGGAALFQRMFTRLGCEGRPPRFRVEFYPYSGLTLTIRRREEGVFVRLSDLLRRAPLAVLEAAAALLLARVYRRKAPLPLVEPYLAYARSGATRTRMNRMRFRRVRQVGWSLRAWRRQFGCYDPGPNQILLNRRLDDPRVPQCAVEYVLFHEMLHLKHPTRRSGCTLVFHSREFREEEKRFADFDRARRILDRLAR